MNQPKKLHSYIDYSSDIFVPELDSDLEEFITIIHEHLDNPITNTDLKELNIDQVGENLFLSEDFELDSNQFEEQIEKTITPSKKSFIKKLFN